MTPASEIQVAAFEECIGRGLPADYRSYLLTENGGSPAAPFYRGDVVEIYVQVLYSLRDDEERGLIWEWSTAHVPKTFKDVLLPIATVNGGDSLLLSLVNGEVFFYEHEIDSFTRIDDSFSDIIAKLHRQPKDA